MRKNNFEFYFILSHIVYKLTIFFSHIVYKLKILTYVLKEINKNWNKKDIYFEKYKKELKIFFLW